MPACSSKRYTASVLSASFDPADTPTYHVVRERVFGQDYAKALAIWRNNFRAGCHRASHDRLAGFGITRSREPDAAQKRLPLRLIAL